MWVFQGRDLKRCHFLKASDVFAWAISFNFRMSGCGNCDAISKIWTAIIFLCIHGYVTYRAISRYVIVKDQIISQKFGVDWDKSVMNLLLWSIVVSLFFTVLCIYAFLQKTGHLANDGIQLKRDTQRILALLGSGDNTPICPNTISKTVSIPTCFSIRLFTGTLYLLSAYSLLLPIPWSASEQIKHQAVNPGNNIVDIKTFTSEWLKIAVWISDKATIWLFI